MWRTGITGHSCLPTDVFFGCRPVKKCISLRRDAFFFSDPRKRADALGFSSSTWLVQNNCRKSTKSYISPPSGITSQRRTVPFPWTRAATVATAEYAWTDPDRVERFTDTGKNRFVNIAFWYPKENGKYPLVVFSHGAFGILMCNASTFTELASNGYVVASIGHPYHSFYTQDIDGKPIIEDMNLINRK